MAVELASKHIQPKPWGVADLGPWSKSSIVGSPIGEIWFGRPSGAPDPSLLLKLGALCYFPVNLSQSRFIQMTTMRSRWDCQTARPRLGMC